MKVTGDLKENQTSIQQYQLIDLPKITDPRGNLTFIEANRHIPFEIKRGLMVGIGWLNKYSIVFFCFGLLVGLLITPNRQFLLNRWIWIAGLIAFTIALPNLIWQTTHGWPFLGIQKEYKADYQVDFWISTINFTLQQIFQMHTLTFPITLAGFSYYFRDTEGKSYRFIGWVCIIVFGLLIILEAREIYYLAPIYPLLWASGAVKVEKLIYNRRRLKSIILAVLITGGIITMPASLPVLPLETFISYSRFSRYLLPIWEYPFMLEPKQVTAPHRWTLGWQEAVATVAKVYHSLLPSEQAKCAILAWDYNYAGAIDVLGGAYDLPKSISGDIGYYFWGPRKYSGEIVISVGGDLNYLQKLFNQVNQVAMITNEKVGKSSNTPIYLCRQIKIPLEQSWLNFRNHW
ncbi:glycosyltransferase family 39 protein [uncultured Nostoc sp.]|uniref:glycosyltransferase family 39 protein n=1 Tax=uncultured Nostoc sp. TaxID=340711 RepID=UPI0035CB5424